MDQLGPYLLRRPLGTGGMGVVHLAHDPVLGRDVALKVIAPHLAADAGFRARFLREARALAALDSPHVVQVHAHGEDDGLLWIATQLVPDGDLGALLTTAGALPRADAADLVAQVALGLADAHAAGVVHRDIKPGNVLLRRRPDGVTAYLADFGIARVLDDRTRTRAATVGTPAYMAPELHTGGAAGVASDVYALGCLLFALLTGAAPYDGASDYEVARAHVERPVPELPGPDPINAVLARALAKDPRRRHRSALAFAEDLRRAAARSPRTPRRWPALAAAAAALVLAGSAAPAAPAAPARTDETASLAAALATTGGLDPDRARCTAERWIVGAGLAAMVAAGFFDERGRYVDRERAAMTPAIRRAAVAAARACATSADASP